MNLENQKILVDKIKSSDLVLDIGGWHAPLNRADYMIDIMPYKTRNRAGAFLTDVWAKEHFSEKTYIQTDICETPWPFKDKQFDFAICSHTLEDIRDPIGVCKEINRVAKAGYIEVPSRIAESTRGVERPFYCGYYHHRWLCEVENTNISFMFKPAMIHAYRKFHFRKSLLKKVNPRYDFVGFFWSENFGFKEKIIIERDDVQKNLMDFKKQHETLPELFIPKYNWQGKKI